MTATKVIRERQHSAAMPIWLLPVSLALASAVFVVDLSLPIGVAGGIPYVALVLIGLWAPRRSVIWGLALAATLLTILGYMLSPPGGLVWVVATNRGLTLLAIWGAAVLVFDRKRLDAKLRESETANRVYAELGSDRFWRMDKDLHFTEMQIRPGKRIDEKLDEPLGKTRWEHAGAIPERDEIWAAHRRILEAHEPFEEFEYTIADASGETWRFSVSGVPLFDGNGEFDGYCGVAKDITSRWRSEKALAESERLYRLVTENSPARIVYVDADRRYRLANAKYLQFFRQTAEQVIGRPARKVIPGEVYEQVAAEIERALSGVETSFEYKVSRQSGGGDYWTSCTYVPDFDEDGQVHGLIAMAIDITERKRAEQALRESEARFRDFAEAASDWFWEMDADLRFTWMSPRAGEVAGVPPEWNYGRTRAELIDSSFDPEGWATHQKTLEEHKPFKNFVYKRDVEAIQGPDRRYVWTRTSGVPVLAEDGSFLGYRGCGSDITKEKLAEEALRESEELLRTMADALPAPVLHVDANERCVFINRAAENWFARPRSEVIGRPIREAHFDETYAAVGPAYRKALAGQQVTLDTTITFRDGVRRDVHVNYAPHFTKDGRVAGFVSLTQDVTEQKGAEEQLRQAQKMEVVGQLTAGVAHDFNNLLAVILGNAELLAEEVGKDNPLLDTLTRATRRGSELTQRLLAFSRKQMLRPEAINLNALIGDVTSLLRRTLEEHIEIETVCGAGLWNCEADPAQVENALVNLAVNARDAMPEGGKLTIETANAMLDDDYAAAQAEVTPGQYVMLAATDSGSGIPAEVRERVFEPFFTTKADGGGSGLGLSMVYGFVKQSGGHVAIYSEPGEGTTVRLYLPRSKATATAERQYATEGAPDGRGETVLVVEDDDDVRMLAVMLLSRLGYQVVEAATGAAGLELLGSTTRTDLLLTDVMLSGSMSGRELAMEAERRVPEIKVLYMSGYAENAIVHHGRLDADVALLQKPFGKADLARAVRKALDRTRSAHLD